MKALKKIQYDNVKPVANGAPADVGKSRDQSWDLNDKSQSHRIWVRVTQVGAAASAKAWAGNETQAGSLQLEQEGNPSSIHWALFSRAQEYRGKNFHFCSQKAQSSGKNRQKIWK